MQKINVLIFILFVFFINSCVNLQTLLNKRDYKGASSYCSTLSNNEKLECYYSIADKYFESSNYINAASYYDSAGELGKSGLIKIANVYIEISDFETALNYFKLAGKLNLGYQLSAKSALDIGDLEKATELLKFVKNPNKQYKLIGDSYLEQKNYKKAIEHYNLCGKSSNNYRTIADVLFQTGDYNLADEYYSKANLLDNKSVNISLLIKMIPEQEFWFRKKVLRPLLDKGVSVTISRFKNYEDLENKLKKNKYDVVKIPMDRATSFISKGLISSISKIITIDEQAKLIDNLYFPKLALNKDEIYYIPRKLETRIMVYRKSKIENVLENYRRYLPALDTDLKKLGLTGISSWYSMKTDLNNWDYMDVLVAGYTWKKLNYGTGKIGHRGKEYSGTFLRIVDRIMQLNGSWTDVKDISSIPAIEAIEWEFIYNKLGAYNKKMFKNSWSGVDIWKAFGKDEVFLSFMTQLDCFFLHGTNIDGMKGYLLDYRDLGFALMPKAFTLSGVVGQEFSKGITTGGWLWGIAETSEQKKDALNLILQLTSYKVQQEEFMNFGTTPTRRSLFSKSKQAELMETWKGTMFAVAGNQLKVNANNSLPADPLISQIQETYFEILKKTVLKSEDIVSIKEIKKIIKSIKKNKR